MKAAVKVIIALAVCAAVIFAAFTYVKSSSGSKQGGPGGPGGGRPAAAGGGKAQGAGGNSAGKGGAGAVSGGGMPSQSANLISVRTLTAEITPLQDYVNTTGEIEPTSSVDVFPDIGGKIQSVSVNVGSYVKKGAVLMKVNPSTPGTQYALNTVYAPIS
ncbi:MAG: biotin/lipoyl-binding protein, partial [Treponema sp.]|nr:biotin/lipoyl-binding protein [Treponema sp.]